MVDSLQMVSSNVLGWLAVGDNGHHFGETLSNGKMFNSDTSILSKVYAGKLYIWSITYIVEKVL